MRGQARGTRKEALQPLTDDIVAGEDGEQIPDEECHVEGPDNISSDIRIGGAYVAVVDDVGRSRGNRS